MKHTKWFWGTFFVLSAVFVIASQVTDFVQIGLWSILGAILLASIIIHSIVHRNFFGIFVPLAFIYEIFWQPFNLAEISVWVLLAAAILASIGFSYIFRSRPPKCKYKWEKWGKEERYKHISENIDDNNPVSKVSFGSSTEYLHSAALKSGQFYASFGSLEVYFDQAQLSPEGAEIYVDCSFGSIELYIPRNWKVISKVHTTLGAADIDERRSGAEANSPILTITGNVSFGAVEVKYI